LLLAAQISPPLLEWVTAVADVRKRSRKGLMLTVFAIVAQLLPVVSTPVSNPQPGIASPHWSKTTTLYSCTHRHQRTNTHATQQARTQRHTDAHEHMHMHTCIRHMYAQTCMRTNATADTAATAREESDDKAETTTGEMTQNRCHLGECFFPSSFGTRRK
jgi:hypothetical protein